MSKRFILATLAGLALLGALTAVAFASYHPLDKKPIVSAPVKQRVVIEKRTVRVVKHRKPKPKAVPQASPASSSPQSSGTVAQTYTPGPAAPQSSPEPSQTHSSGYSGGEDEGGEDEGGEYEGGEDEGDEYEGGEDGDD